MKRLLQKSSYLASAFSLSLNCPGHLPKSQGCILCMFEGIRYISSLSSLGEFEIWNILAQIILTVLKDLKADGHGNLPLKYLKSY